jgi:hypothetical protein
LSSFQNQLSPPGFSLSATAENLLPSATSIDRYRCRIRNSAAGIASVGIIGTQLYPCFGLLRQFTVRTARALNFGAKSEFEKGMNIPGAALPKSIARMAE